MIGAQKAMGGPAGVSAVAVSARAWQRFAENPQAPRRSYLSLLDWKERWIDGGRKALPHAPAQLEMLALEACLERIGSEGQDAVMERHARAAAATRAGVLALGGGFEPYVHAAADAAPVATTLRVPERADASELVAKALATDPGLPLIAGGGALAKEMIRINHYGPDANQDAVSSSLAALGAALGGRVRKSTSMRPAARSPRCGRTAEVHFRSGPQPSTSRAIKNGGPHQDFRRELGNAEYRPFPERLPGFFCPLFRTSNAQFSTGPTSAFRTHFRSVPDM